MAAMLSAGSWGPWGEAARGSGPRRGRRGFDSPALTSRLPHRFVDVDKGPFFRIRLVSTPHHRSLPPPASATPGWNSRPRHPQACSDSNHAHACHVHLLHNTLPLCNWPTCRCVLSPPARKDALASGSPRLPEGGAGAQEGEDGGPKADALGSLRRPRSWSSARCPWHPRAPGVPRALRTPGP